MKAPAGLVVTVAVGEEHAAVKHLRKSLHVALLQGGPAILPALFGGLMGDGPIGIGGARDALDALKHVALAKSEARYVDGAVAELRQRGRPVRLVVRELLQTQQVGDGSAALRPGAGVDGDVAVVEQDEGALLEIEAVAIGSAAQAKLVPEVADQQQVRADAEALNLGANAVPGVAKQAVVAQPVIGGIKAEPVGQDIRHAGLGGRTHELADGVARSRP